MLEVAGSITEQEFTVEIDSSDLWQEIESSVEECAGEAISNYMDYYEHDVDFTEGASNLLGEYHPGTGCSLAREFEAAVHGAVLVNGWLADQLIERGITAPENSPPLQSQEEIRKVVRSEVRMALATALGTLTNGEEA